MSATKYRKKLLETAIPLEVVNIEGAARKRKAPKGYPTTFHTWWAQRPLAAARAVLFAQLVDDPSAWPEFFPTAQEQEAERQRLFGVIASIVPWEASNDRAKIGLARREIARSWARSHPSKIASRILAEDAPDEVIDEYLVTAIPPVHDPFAGGGTIPLEAQRLGLRVIASDLNPVAVLINKALVDLPARFAGLPPVHPDAGRGKKPSTTKQTSMPAASLSWLGAEGIAADVRRYGRWIRDEAWRRIGHLYPDVEVRHDMASERQDLSGLVGEQLPVVAYLWARTIASPDPSFLGVHVPLVSSYWLSTKKGKQAWVEPVIDDRSYRFEVRTGVPRDKAAISSGTKLGRGANFRCLLSGSPISPDYVKKEAAAKKLGVRLMAVVVDGKRSRVFLDATDEQERLAHQAKPDWAPDQALPENPRWFSPPDYGMPNYADLFTPRQLLVLGTFSNLVQEAREKVREDALAVLQNPEQAAGYADACALYLSAVISRVADYGSSLSSWRPKDNAMRSTIPRQAIPMVWDFAEGSPFGKSSSGFLAATEVVAAAIERCGHLASAPATVFQASAEEACASHQGAIVCTDPPYFDNIGYADLSDFFYVWLRRTLKDVCPTLFATLASPKQNELIASPYRHGGKEAAQKHFRTGMERALRAVFDGANRDCPVVIYYAFKQAETDIEGTASTGWDAFLQGLHRSGFATTSTWPLRTEGDNRQNAAKTNALASSIVLACRARDACTGLVGRGDFRRQLQRELPAALHILQSAKLAPVDMAQASIGPGMSVLGRFERVLESDGKEVAMRAVLQMINEVLDESLEAQETALDAESRFALTWFETRAFAPGPYGDAETLAMARAVSVSGVVEAGIAEAAGGKVRLLSRRELPQSWDPSSDSRLTTWEATQHLIKRMEEQGEDAAADLLNKLGSLSDAARDLAYRLYSTCERKGWAEEARAYNGLVVAWPDLERLAAQASAEPFTPAQQKLL